ncbi:MAG TPA: dynamin family protein [Kineosporiaceae bacterium]|nr:dynamin family protein [Kineosporiaceae bacterium]
MDQPSAGLSRTTGGQPRPPDVIRDLRRALPPDGPAAAAPAEERPAPEAAAVLSAAERFRQEIAELTFPYVVPGVEDARRIRDEVLDRLDNFVLPRLRRVDAPLLVVVGGSAGSGKSTLTNSLVGARVSPEGVLRPTTRTPVLAHHPRDASAFLSRRVLPGLARTTGEAATAPAGEPAPPPAEAPAELRLVPHWAVTPGLAIIDSPDLNSRADGNRELARQLFGVADLWVFVATGTDYADAAPWDLLAEAVERQVSIAVVLNRMRESEAIEVRRHFATMLRDAGLASAAFFTLPETELAEGLLPSWRMVAMQTWLARQAADVQAREGHVRRAVAGTLTFALRRAEGLLEGAQAQAGVEQQLRSDVRTALGRAGERLAGRIADGSLIDAEVEALWHRVAGDSRAGRWLNRGTGPGGRRVDTGDATEIGRRVQAAAARLVRTEALAALAQLADRWHGHAAAGNISDGPWLFAPPDGFDDEVAAQLSAWRLGVVSRAGGGSTGEAATGPALAVLSLAVGADAGWIGPVAVGLAESALNRSEVRGQIRKAAEDLRARFHGLLVRALERPQGMLDEIGMGPGRPQRLTAAANGLAEALTANRAAFR